MDDVFNEAVWRETIDRDNDCGEYPWLTDSKACEHAVINVMIEHAPWSVGNSGSRGWSLDDAKRVASACQVFYTPGPRIDDNAYEQVGEEHVSENYPGADKDPIIGFDSEDFERIGRGLAKCENESGRSVWIECDDCMNLYHFDGAMVRGETTP